MQISQFFLNGDIKGAIAYMRDHEEFKDILPAYAAILKIVNTARSKYRICSTISCACIKSIFVTHSTADYRKRMRQAS